MPTNIEAIGNRIQELTPNLSFQLTINSSKKQLKISEIYLLQKDNKKKAAISKLRNSLVKGQPKAIKDAVVIEGNQLILSEAAVKKLFAVNSLLDEPEHSKPEILIEEDEGDETKPLLEFNEERANSGYSDSEASSIADHTKPRSTAIPLVPVPPPRPDLSSKKDINNDDLVISVAETTSAKAPSSPRIFKQHSINLEAACQKWCNSPKRKQQYIFENHELKKATGDKKPLLKIDSNKIICKDDTPTTYDITAQLLRAVDSGKVTIRNGNPKKQEEFLLALIEANPALNKDLKIILVTGEGSKKFTLGKLIEDTTPSNTTTMTKD